MTADLRDTAEQAAMQRPGIFKSGAAESFPPDIKGQTANAAAPALLARAWRLPLRMLGRGGLSRFALVTGGTVAGTWLGEEMLDFLHKEMPDNAPIAKADYVMRKAWGAEKFLFRLGRRAAKAGYDAIPAQAAEKADVKSVVADKGDLPNMPPAQPAPDAAPASPTDVTPRTLVAVSPAPAKPHRANTASLREAGDIADPETERLNRAELARHQQPTAQPAPDGMPASGGYDPATGIAWNGYLKANPSLPVPAPVVVVEPDLIDAEPMTDGYFEQGNFVPEGHSRHRGEDEFRHIAPRVPRLHGPAFGPMRHH